MGSDRTANRLYTGEELQFVGQLIADIFVSTGSAYNSTSNAQCTAALDNR